MRVHQPRENRGPAEVLDLLAGVGGGDFQRGADGRHAAAAHEDRAAADFFAAGVLGDDPVCCVNHGRFT